MKGVKPGGEKRGKREDGKSENGPMMGSCRRLHKEEVERSIQEKRWRRTQAENAMQTERMAKKKERREEIVERFHKEEVERRTRREVMLREMGEEGSSFRYGRSPHPRLLMILPFPF